MAKMRTVAACGTAFALAASLALVGCGGNAGSSSSSTSSEVPATDSASTEATDATTTIANPWSEAPTARAAAEGAGVDDLRLPEDGATFVGGEVHWTGYQYMEGLAEADGAIGSAEFVVRKGLESVEQEVADVSGDWNTYEYSWDVDADGTQVRCSGNDEGRATKATWTEGGYDFAMLIHGQGDGRDTYGLGADDVAALVGAIG